MGSVTGGVMDRVRWGIIGTGDVAETKGGPALYKAAHSSLVAVMSRNAGRAAAFAARHGAKRHYHDVAALLADEEMDAVYIATPPDSHAALTIRAAEAGKHVLCEKPMALRVAEGEAMVAACRTHGVALMVAYYRRFFPIINTMRELIAAGTIGTLMSARTAVADYYTPRTDGERRWLTDAQVAGGGFLMDVGCHRLDLLSHFLGPAETVAALIDTRHFDFAVDDSSALLLRFAGGVPATAAFNWNVGAAIDEFELCGTKGRLLARNLGHGDLVVITQNGAEQLHLPPPSIPHLGLVENFVTSLRTGQPNALPGEAGLAATRILEGAYRAAREGRVVQL